MRVGLYARRSTYDRQTLTMQLKQMREYIRNRKWESSRLIKNIPLSSKELFSQINCLRLVAGFRCASFRPAPDATTEESASDRIDDCLLTGYSQCIHSILTEYLR